MSEGVGLFFGMVFVVCVYGIVTLACLGALGFIVSLLLGAFK